MQLKNGQQTTRKFGKLLLNPDLTVEQAAREAGVEITGYVRMEVGEGIEKKEEDFAAEVAKVVQG